ncbi:MAG TPA: glycosyltransferase family A protein [Candidatus Acidoferrales bacterium]|nr:glycosyltransferase family A protein [Candidatus Acidoferrales bacterium]
MANPLVTVLVDTYNHERFIEEAIVSVLEQDFPRSDMEILVVDDGSTDRTPEILRKFEPDVRVLRKANGGQASAFNAGIPQARGEIVAFLDGDDWWAKNKLSRVVQTMAADPALGVVGNGIVTIRRDGSRESEILREGFRFRANSREGALLLRLRKSLLGTSRLAMRADLLRTIGRVPEQLVVEADEFLFTLGAVMAETQILPDVLTFYRLHEQNGFQISANAAERSRRKMEVLAALANMLSARLQLCDMEPEACEAIVDVVRAEATQAKLMLDGGWPWQTATTEWALYTAACPQGSTAHRLFKLSTLATALVLPPRAFYKWRALLANSAAYMRTRRIIFPYDRPQHVKHISNTGTTGTCGS